VTRWFFENRTLNTQIFTERRSEYEIPWTVLSKSFDDCLRFGRENPLRVFREIHFASSIAGSDTKPDV